MFSGDGGFRAAVFACPITAKDHRKTPKRSPQLYFSAVIVAVIFCGETCAPHEVWVTVTADRLTLNRNGSVFIFKATDRVVLPRVDAITFRRDALVSF